VQPPHPLSARDSSTDALALQDAAAALDPPTRAALAQAVQQGRVTRLQVAQAWLSSDRAGPAFARWVRERLAPTVADTLLHGSSAGAPRAAPTAEAGPAERIGPYVVDRELARGGMGVVYVATHAQLGRRVALKLLPTGAREEEQERFQLESQAVARLKHPNIVGVHDVGVEKNQPWLAMDLIEGESLHARLSRDGALGEEEAATIVEKVARAVAYAHKAGLLHRDIKPHNVLLDGEGEPFLADFGLAKDVRKAAKGVTVTGQVIGTPAYMPPEQAAGDLELVDRRSDVYSLGATLYHALTGQLPFDGATPVRQRFRSSARAFAVG
jgi:serine/threonine protein kinase